MLLHTYGESHYTSEGREDLSSWTYSRNLTKRSLSLPPSPRIPGADSSLLASIPTASIPPTRRLPGGHVGEGVMGQSQEAHSPPLLPFYLASPPPYLAALLARGQLARARAAPAPTYQHWTSEPQIPPGFPSEQSIGNLWQANLGGCNQCACAKTTLPRMRSPFVSCWKECGRRGIRVVWQMLLAPELSCSAPARLEGEAAPPSTVKACTVTRTHPCLPVRFQRAGEENRVCNEHFPFTVSGLGSGPPSPVVDSPSGPGKACGGLLHFPQARH